jgi:hypothetical protein
MKIGDKILCVESLEIYNKGCVYSIIKISNELVSVGNNKDFRGYWAFTTNKSGLDNEGCNRFILYNYFISMKELRRKKLKKIFLTN